MWRAAIVLALLVGCDSQPSPLDQPVAPAQPDPWDSPAPGSSSSEDKASAFGFDFSGILERIGAAVKKPGPYEAPRKSEDFDEAKPHLVVLELDGPIVERAAYSLSPFGGGSGGVELGKVVARLRELAADETVSGVMLRIGNLRISLPDTVELRAVMHELRAAKKTLACHTEDASNATYLVLAACDRIGLAPLGQLAITGPAAMPIHVKGLLDRLGIQADFLHVGAYKGAAEPLTRDAPSAEMEATLGAILDRHYQTMVDVIAAARSLDAATVRRLIDGGMYSADQARAAKLIDDVGAFEAFRDAAKAPWQRVPLEDRGDDSKLAGMSKLMRFLGMMQPDRPMSDHVAVVYAIGNIVDGDGDGVLGARQEIAAQTLVAALRALTADDAVKAVVLRIDSGGGSAQASELIWEAVRDLKAKKPVVVSMSDVAASGGYYIACGATKIFALADTLTGSIGVVGGKIAPGNALAKLGVATFPRGRGKHATLMASFQPWTADEKALIQRSMEDVYAVFTGRVADGRKLAPARVEELAQGRVWTGAAAKELGLVDELGGLDAALAEAQRLGGVPPAVDLEIYPPSPTLRDVLQGWGGAVRAPLVGSVLGEIEAIDPQLGAAAQRLVELVLSFRRVHVQTLAVLPEVR
jgi:protease IV